MPGSRQHPDFFNTAVFPGKGRWPALAAVLLVQCLLLILLYSVWLELAESVTRQSLWGGFRFSNWVHKFRQWRFWAEVGATTVAMVAAQAVFVLPVRKPRARREAGPAIFASLSMAAIGIACLAVAIGFAASEALSMIGIDAIEKTANRIGLWPLILIGGFVSWSIATPLLLRFARRRTMSGERWESVLDRLSARLFLGTIVEVAAIMPVDVLVRRKDNCYCWAGTYVALTICGGLGLIVLGPMILFPALARRRRRWYAGRCDACGYDLSGLVDRQNIDRCPECGCGWRAGRGA